MPPILVGVRVPLIRRFWRVPCEQPRILRTSLDLSQDLCGWSVDVRKDLISIKSSRLNSERSDFVMKSTFI